MIPYVDSELGTLFGWNVHWFGICVAVAVVLGHRLSVAQGRKRNLDEGALRRVNAWMVTGGLLISHGVEVLDSNPRGVLDNPWVLLDLRAGLSSFGGFLGAALIMLYLTHKYRLPRLAYADAVALGLAPAWIVARLGCFAAHDHPGSRSTFFLAVRYPGGSRHDLGLEEALFTAAITVVLYLYARNPRPAGRLIGMLAVLYTPGRFLLDFSRATDTPYPDPRYASLTFAQWACWGVLAVGLSLLHRPPPPGTHARRAWETPRRRI